MTTRRLPSGTSEDARRRRPANACTTCRERRVKCDRKHPVCSACKKGRHQCRYLTNPSSTLAFVPETHCASVNAPSSVDTWSDVIASQVGFAERSVSVHNGAAREEAPLWSLGEPAQRSAFSEQTGTFTYLPPRGSLLIALGDDLVSSLRNSIPEYQIGMSLLDSYLRNCHPLVPICDVPSLKTIVPLLWCQHPEQMAIETVLLVLAVLYAAASTSQDTDQSRYAQTLSTLYKSLTGRLEFGDYFIASPSIPLLQAFMLHSTFRACHLAPFAAFGFLPQAIRFAQMLGLHKDQKVLHPTKRELRRRTWWHLVFLDVESTISSGLQSIIRPSGHDTPLPSPTAGDLGLPYITEDSSPVLMAMQGHWLLAQAIHKWVEQRPGHDEILAFGRKIKSLASGIGQDSTQATWARLYLHLQIDRAYCMLGLRFWQLDQFKATSCHSEVVSTARSFLRNYLELVRLGRGSGFGWFVPGFLQPLHALVILLKHLSGCSNQESEGFTGSYDLITQVIDARREWIMRGPIWPLPAQLLPGSGTVLTERAPGDSMTDPRYRMLWTLKEEVWQRFGWPTPKTTQTAAITIIDGISEAHSAFGFDSSTEQYDTQEVPATLIDDRQSDSGCQPAVLRQPDSVSNEHDHLQSPNITPMDHSDGGGAGAGAAIVSDRYFDIDDLIPPSMDSPVHWDAWLLDFHEDNPSCQAFS